MLYSFYSFPNMIIPLFGGILLDRVGLGPGLMLTSWLVTIGQMTIATGGYLHNYNFLLLGRIIFGLGAETLYVV